MMSKKWLSLTLLTVLCVSLTTMCLVPAFAQSPIEEHAVVPGYGKVITHDVSARGQGFIIFFTYTPSDSCTPHAEPGISVVAISFRESRTTFWWHITDVTAWGKYMIVKAMPHPSTSDAPGSTAGPAPIKIVICHGCDRPWVIAMGMGVYFWGHVNGDNVVVTG